MDIFENEVSTYTTHLSKVTSRQRKLGNVPFCAKLSHLDEERAIVLPLFTTYDVKVNFTTILAETMKTPFTQPSCSTRNKDVAGTLTTNISLLPGSPLAAHLAPNKTTIDGKRSTKTLVKKMAFSLGEEAGSDSEYESAVSSPDLCNCLSGYQQSNMNQTDGRTQQSRPPYA